MLQDIIPQKIFKKNSLKNIHVLYDLYIALTRTPYHFVIFIHFCFCFIKKLVKYITFLLLSLSHRSPPHCFKL
ncbi:hypothetical protein FZC77_21990 [Bacillus swezeyi]|uniref:Uncharacterized protein n=1 Tax=Bacillus swezeyi TaxID=1925020 RepID=A0A5M8RFI0_9BACI|nr:hypothetical protein DX927_22715 [Bacillus swezeyi]KAA6473034.1 hypothetical protein DX928_21990 [Bacillus swezeyi]TYS32918.1 hypothetical protein FZC77_21990 [Bacillus swezeyi]